ncbi:SDR family oxidoreductase [Shimia sp. MMG029]|uniref:SDR family oxidoreductase n=1 Tax=Shimia sp. MMG029 TaxID=3021978 RepID=UPI0022FF3C9F|nr:SDR family oxidoreductase [Shimia sp. MMG029]MDA5558676.1 SDR family oxidoreductase [Shimia sp. MMG029]
MPPALPCFDLSGQNALITGSTEGLGHAAAALLAEAGAHVWINGRAQDRCQNTADDFTNRGLKASPLTFDVADETATDAAFATLQAAGGLSILINNVGMRDRRALQDFTHADLVRLFGVDLVAPFRLAQRAAAQMQTNGYGQIVNVSSIAGLIAQSGDAAYTSAKAGLNGMTKALAAELGHANINVNAIAPGFFKTAPNAAAAQDPDIAARLESATSLGRWGDPAELAPAILFLASPTASYVTGQILAVDGGYTSHY